MVLPPVIERARHKGLSQEEIRAFVADRVVIREGIFGRLTEQFLGHLQDVAWRLVSLPGDDAYWTVAYPSGNFMDAIHRHLEWHLSTHPGDESVSWALAGLSALGTDDETSYNAWMPLVERDPRNIRWMIESAIFILEESGHDSSEELSNALGRVESRRPVLKDDLRAFSEGDDRHLARASQVALRVLEGHRLTELKELHLDNDK